MEERSPEDIRRAALLEELLREHPSVKPVVEWLMEHAETLGFGILYRLTRSEMRQLFPLGMNGSAFDLYYKSLVQATAHVRRTKVLPELRVRRMAGKPWDIELYLGPRSSHGDRPDGAAPMPKQMLGEATGDSAARKKPTRKASEIGWTRADKRWRLLHPEVKELLDWLRENASAFEGGPQFMTYGKIRKAIPLGMSDGDANAAYYDRLRANAKWIRANDGLPVLWVEERRRPVGVDLFVGHKPPGRASAAAR
jgi:hypothetical protein